MRKKILSLGILFILITMLLVLTGCGNNTTSQNSDGNNKNNAVSKVSILDNMKSVAQQQLDNMFNYNFEGWTQEIQNGMTETVQDTTKQTSGVFKFEENENTYYYYRGNVENNYVEFAGYYWRIIRTNADETIRMIYAGTSPDSSGEDIAIGTTKYNVSTSNLNMTGYTYDGNDSKVKTYLETWYKENIENTEYDKYVATQTYVSDSTRSEEEFISAIRIRYNAHDADVANPTLAKSKTTESYGGNYESKVGLLTVDEALMAGLNQVSGEGAVDTYLSATTGSQKLFWTMSPLDEYGKAYVYTIGGQIYSAPVDKERAVRPVISLNSDALNNMVGDGTKENPYKIAK